MKKDFSWALLRLKEGKSAWRQINSWLYAGFVGVNEMGVGRVVMAQFPDEKSKMTDPYFFLSTPHQGRVPWTPTQEDMFADDWQCSGSEEGLTEHSISEISAINLSRALKWHKNGLNEWSVGDWGNALSGEVGELCNLLKKIRRIECEIQQAEATDIHELTERAGLEIADVYFYLDLVAQRIGVNLYDVLVKKFNAISVREGFPERL